MLSILKGITISFMVINLVAAMWPYSESTKIKYGSQFIERIRQHHEQNFALCLIAATILFASPIIVNVH